MRRSRQSQTRETRQRRCTQISPSRSRSPKSITDLIEIAGTPPPATVVVIGGDRIEDLQLVESARDHGIVDRIILVGRGKSIAEAVESAGIKIDPANVLPVDSAEQVSTPGAAARAQEHPNE